MQFWSGTAVMDTSDALAATRMLDETGFDEDIGVTAVMCAPWLGAVEVVPGDVESLRGPIERFAETVSAKVR